MLKPEGKREMWCTSYINIGMIGKIVIFLGLSEFGNLVFFSGFQRMIKVILLKRHFLGFLPKEN